MSHWSRESGHTDGGVTLMLRMGRITADTAPASRSRELVFLLFQLGDQSGASLPARAAVPQKQNPGPPSGAFTPLGTIRVIRFIRVFRVTLVTLWPDLPARAHLTYFPLRAASGGSGIVA